MYSFKSRVRYSEVDSFGRLSTFSAINYLQDCSTFQSEDIGLGIKKLKERRRAWWLSSWYIEFDGPLLLGENIKINTWAYGFSGFYGYRNFTIDDETGKHVVKADSTWFFFDLDKHRPVKPEKEDIEAYINKNETKLSMNTPDRKIEKQGKVYKLSDIVITRHFLDTNEHVNNAYYAAIAKESVEEVHAPTVKMDRCIKSIQIHYKKAAVLGSRVVRTVYEKDDGYIVELAGTEFDTVYADIKIIYTEDIR